MPKPAPPPSQVESRHQQLTERYMRLFNKKKTLEGQAARNAEAELQSVLDEARGLENQFNFPETTKLQEFNAWETPDDPEKSRRIAELSAIIERGEQLSESELGEWEWYSPGAQEPDWMRTERIQKRVYRTVGSRYAEDYKSKTKRDY